MPIATVPGESGRVKAQHGADLAGAQPRDEPFDSGLGRRTAAERPRSSSITSTSPTPRAAGRHRPARIAAAGFRDWLWTCCWCRLANVNDRLALQHRGRQQISARHRHAPRAAMPAACNNRLASLVSGIPALARRSHPAQPYRFESIGWRAGAGLPDRSVDGGGVFIARSSWMIARTVRRASSETVLDQQLMQFSQRRQRDPSGAPNSPSSAAGGGSSIRAATTTTTPGATST